MPASSKPSHRRRTNSIQVSLDPAAPGRADLRWIKRMIAAAVARLELSGATLNFVIIADARMAELHEQFSGVPDTTDVLTFDLRDDPQSDHLEGELYLCADEARRRGEELGHGADRELLLYAIHGMLHLLGHDDHAAAAHRRMHAEEDRILRAIGVGPVFAAAAPVRKPRRRKPVSLRPRGARP